MISIQILRGLAALLVVLYHIAKKGVVAGAYPSNFFEFGQFGVEIFFIISGFIMSYITAGKDINVSSFMVKRAVRILPMYWFFSTIALCALIAIPTLAFTHTDLPPGIISSYLLLPEPDHSLLLLVGWTLSYELLFYMVFALATKVSGRPIAAALALLWGLSFVVPQGFYLNFVFNDFWAEFLAGTLLFKIAGRKQLLVAAGVAALAVFLAFYWHGLPHRRSVYFGLPALAVFAIVVGLEDVIKRWHSKFVVPALKFLGDASYSIYLSHFFSLNLGYLIIYKILKLSGAGGGAIYMIFSIVLCLFAGSLAHVLLEKRILRLVGNIGEWHVRRTIMNRVDTDAI